MGAVLSLGRIAGIRVGLHWSWLVAAALVLVLSGVVSALVDMDVDTAGLQTTLDLEDAFARIQSTKPVHSPPLSPSFGSGAGGGGEDTPEVPEAVSDPDEGP